MSPKYYVIILKLDDRYHEIDIDTSLIGECLYIDEIMAKKNKTHDANEFKIMLVITNVPGGIKTYESDISLYSPDLYTDYKIAEKSYTGIKVTKAKLRYKIELMDGNGIAKPEHYPTELAVKFGYVTEDKCIVA